MTSLSEDISLYDFCIKNPEATVLLKLWSNDNSPLTPEHVRILSFKRVIWNINGNRLEFSVYEMVHALKSHLYGRKIEQDSLIKDNPDLCKEWAYELNEFGPEYYTRRTHCEVFWRCSEHGTYSLPIDWRNRVNGRGCPLCRTKQSSYPEQALFTYLSNTFKDTLSRFKIDGYEYDIYIPSIKLAIEYDGYPWHSGKIGMHTLKKHLADNNGITLLNIAEYKEGKLDKVKSDYIINNVSYYKPTYTYDNFTEIIDNLRKYILVSYSIDCGEFNISIQKEAKTRSKKRVQPENSALADKPWLVEFVDESDRYKLDYLSKAGATEEVKIVCPECGEFIGKRTMHTINSQFVGCGRCGYKGNIPKEHLDKVTKKNDNSNKNRKK